MLRICFVFINIKYCVLFDLFVGIIKDFCSFKVKMVGNDFFYKGNLL